MLSRRDKLLIQPWHERRYNDHRTKVQSALPSIDASAPRGRPHVALKLKKCQRELDRKNKIQKDNFSLLQRLNAIMTVNRLDNHWSKPLPNFQRKVGVYFDTASLRGRLEARASVDEPAAAAAATEPVRCYACELRKKTRLQLDLTPRSSHHSLPSIYLRHK